LIDAAAGEEGGDEKCGYPQPPPKPVLIHDEKLLVDCPVF
jgi:hypothetical protein